MDRINIFRKWSLAIAETIDAWRIVPRVIITGYSILVWYMVDAFLAIETISKVDCDAAVLKVLLEGGQSLETATNIACRVVDTIGPPISYTTLLSVVIGAAAAVFGLYASTGKDWSKSINPWKWGSTKKPKADDAGEDSFNTMG